MTTKPGARATTEVRVVSLCGSLRRGSVNAAVLETVRRVAPVGMTVTRYDDMRRLPAFDPDDDRDPLAPSVAGLRRLIADALLICTPEYAGALPGAFKNLLDWTVGSPDMDGLPVAWINASGTAAPTGGADAHESLRKVLGYLNAAIVEEACIRVPVLRGMIGGDGTVDDAETRAAFAAALDALGAAALAARLEAPA
jgi:chromate reductase